MALQLHHSSAKGGGAIVVAPAGRVASQALEQSASRLDAMGYVEATDAAALREANRLVEAELRRGGPAPAMPPARAPRHSAALASELERLEKGDDAAPLDVARYACEAPSEETDPAAWRAARDNVRAQLEHQANRVVNLELAEAFAEGDWGRHVHDLKALKAQLEGLAAAKQREAEQINLKRKADQAKIGPEILRHERRNDDAAAKHRKLSASIDALKKQVADLEAAAAA